MYDECETSRRVARHRQGCNLGEDLKYAPTASSCSFVHITIVCIAALACSSEPQCDIMSRILSASSHTVANFCKGCKNVACPDRAYGAAAAHGAEPVAAGIGEPARHLGELPQSLRARPAHGQRRSA